LKLELPEGEIITLVTASYCRFIDDRRQSVYPSDFFNRYSGEKVTIDFIEPEPGFYVVEECRSGSK
jgi:hypothetical protein